MLRDRLGMPNRRILGYLVIRRERSDCEDCWPWYCKLSLRPSRDGLCGVRADTDDWITASTIAANAGAAVRFVAVL